MPQAKRGNLHIIAKRKIYGCSHFSTAVFEIIFSLFFLMRKMMLKVMLFSTQILFTSQGLIRV